MTKISDSIGEFGTLSLPLAKHDINSLANLVLAASGSLVVKLSHSNAPYGRFLRERIQQLHGTCNDLIPLIADIKEKIHGDSAFVNPSAVYNLRYEFECTRDNFLGIAKAKRVDLSVSFDSSTQTAFWDMDSLRIHVLHVILSNVLNNAPVGGSTNMSVTKLDEYTMLIEISDSAKDLPAFQTDSILPSRQKLAGDALNNAQMCIHAHKGKLSVIDAPDFSGTTYRIEIPLFSLCIQ
jgi:signal transduction histidine kinase